MRLLITHETRYRYALSVQASEHWAHLQPIQTPCQSVVQHALHIAPSPQDMEYSLDVFGNPSAHWHLRQPHDTMTVTACSQVDTWTLPFMQSSVGWESAKATLHSGIARVEGAPYLHASRHVPLDQAFSAYAQSCFWPGRSLADAAIALCQRMHQDFEYAPSTTHIDTPAADVLATRRGVCQDFAHVLLACFRSLGLAAGYVSGYLLTQPPPGQVRLVGQDGSHAWVRLYVPDLAAHPCQGWLHLDPTNHRYALGNPGEDYVQLAIGRDFADVSPLSGTLQGGGAHTLQVGVTVVPFEESQGLFI